MKTNLLAVSVVVVGLLGCGVDSSATVEAGEPEALELTEAELSWAGNDPQLWRRMWFTKYAHKLTAPSEAAVARGPFTASKTVLLIPGTTIGTEFFAPMEARLKRDGFDVVVWAPPDLFTESLATGGARIGAKVEEVLASRRKTRLSIVAECDAGIAARYYATLLGGHARLDQLVTFVSAHHGSSIAPAGSWFTGWAALGDVKRNSPLLTQLNAAPMPSGLKLTSIYSCRDEYLWPQNTSFVQGATNVEYCARSVSHFSGFWDLAVYERILTTVRGEGPPVGTYERW